MVDEEIDYYALLIVPIDASFDEIREAHAKRVAELQAGSSPLDEDTLRGINHAHSVLSDPIRRSIYDSERARRKGGLPSSESRYVDSGGDPQQFGLVAVTSAVLIALLIVLAVLIPSVREALASILLSPFGALAALVLGSWGAWLLIKRSDG